MFLVQTSIAGAVDITIPAAPPPFTSTQTLTDPGDTLTVEEGGIIDTLAGTNGVNTNDDNQTVNNAGTIEAGNHGVRVRGSNTVVTNTGTIEADEWGIFADVVGDSNGLQVFNYGTIDAVGIGINTIQDNSVLSNYGTIVSTGTGDFQGRGVNIGTFSENSTFSNWGLVDVIDDGVISFGDQFTFINNGTVIAGDNAFSVVRGENSKLVNNGTMKVVSGRGNGVDSFFTIEALAANVEIINRGNIIALDGFDAIFFGDFASDAILSLLAGSVIDGNVTFDGANPTLNIGTGLNLYLAYSGYDPTVNSEIPIVYDDVNNIIYTIDPTDFALSQSFIQTLSGAVHGAVQSGTGFGNGVGGGYSGNDTFAYGANAPGFADEGPRGWASAFGGYQEQNGTGNITGADQTYGGLVTGGGFASGERMYGAFAGASYSRLQTEYDTHELDATSVYGGVYGGTAFGDNWLSANLAFGYTSFDSERTVANNTVAGGLETASADYDGYFISPSLTLGRSLTDRLEVSVGGHYAGLFLDGYTETGSSANLTVDSRDVHVAAVRGQVTFLAFEKPTNGGGRASIETWAGIDGYFNLGSDDVVASVAGLPFDAFPASFADSAAIGFVGIGVNHKPTSGNWHLNTSLEGRYGTDNYAEIRASASFAKTF